MSAPTRTLIYNARIVCPQNLLVYEGGILFESAREGQEHGIIVDVGPHLFAPDTAPGVIRRDGQGHHVLPGLVDLRVVLGEPGAEHKETFKSAGRAAAIGGVTTMVAMPSSELIIDEVALVDFVKRRARDRSRVRVLPAAAMTMALEGQQMSEIGLMREAGAVMFSNGDRPITDTRLLRRILTYSTAFDTLVAHRPQDAFLAGAGVMHDGALSQRLGLAGIPAIAELIGAERDLNLARYSGAKLLVDLVSSAMTLPAIARAKDAGARVYASTSVHHLTLNEMDVCEYRTFARLTPPLRSEEDRLALIEAVKSGLIDVIVSGHDPQPAENKRVPFDEAAPGASALETLLAGALTLYHEDAIDLPHLVRALTLRPAQLIGQPTGRLEPGAPADVILVDIGAPWKVDAKQLRSKGRNTPFDERLLQGLVEATWVGGSLVHERHSAET